MLNDSINISQKKSRVNSYCLEATDRFKDFRRFLPAIYADESKKETDPWYQFSGAIDEFNVIRQARVECSRWISADESMSAWRPRTTALGGLPNISFVVRKPEPLGKIMLQLINSLATINYLIDLI